MFHPLLCHCAYFETLVAERLVSSAPVVECFAAIYVLRVILPCYSASGVGIASLP